MIRCQLALCAEKTPQDSTTNTISVIGILEKIAPPILPIVMGTLSCYFLLNRDATDPEDIEVALRIVLSDVEILKHNVSVKFQGTFQTRLIANLAGFPITSPGMLRISLSWHDQVVASYECAVEVPSAPIQMSLPTASH